MSLSRLVNALPVVRHVYELVERNLAVRIAAVVVAIILTLIITLVTIHTHALRQDLSERMIDSGVARAAGLANVARQFLEGGQLFDLVKVIGEGGHDANVLNTTVYDVRRSFLMQADGIVPGVTSADLDPLTRRVLAEKQQLVGNGRTLEIARPIFEQGELIGVVRMNLSLAESHTIASELISRTSLVGLLFALIITPIIFVMMDRFSRPIRKLTAAAERASHGDLEVKIEAVGRDEVGILGHSFNRMLKHMRASMKQIHDLAYVDGVTGLPNREGFREIVNPVIAGKADRADACIIFMDLDRFKRVNDTLGHTKGDELLQLFALRLQQRLDSQFGHGDAATAPTLARVGGDEFVIFIPVMRSHEEIRDFARRIKRDLEEPFLVDGNTIVVSVSLGATVFPQDGLTFDTLLRNGDMAMYQAKAAGGNQLHFYTDEMRKKARTRLVVENELRQALENEEFVLYYQPQLACRNGELKGVEALIRWEHPEKGMVPPGHFIEVAEETGLIVDIGDWVMHQACLQAKTWFAEGRHVRVAINVSALQFERGDFTRRVMRALEDSGAGPEMIELELTESLAMSDIKAVVDRIEPLRAIGIRFAIDDFGSGYSSLAYLSKLTFDCFKIDRSFIQNIGKTGGDEAIVRTILGMAKSLGYETVAEGIETMEQYAFLRNEGCDLAQGFLFARPMPASQLEAWHERRMNNQAHSLQSAVERGLVDLRGRRLG